MTFQFIIQVKESNNPEVWRRMEAPDNLTFHRFHKAITIAFGKTFHILMYCFSPPGNEPGPRIDCVKPISLPGYYAKTTKLSDIFKYSSQSIDYVPDYDECWLHHIVLEKIVNKDISSVICLAGEGAYPPGTCAGPDDYEEMKQALSDTNHPKHALIRDWLELSEDETWEEKHKPELSAVNERLLHIDDDIKSFRNYTIVPHDTFDGQYGLTPLLWKKIDRIRDAMQRGKNQNLIISELKRLVRDNPRIPHFQNTLALEYQSMGDKERFHGIMQQVIPAFPDYTMSRSSLAQWYIEDGNLHQAAELLGENFDLSALYPNRNGQFTDVEINNYHVVVTHYLIKTKNHKEAVKHFNYLEDLNPLMIHLEKLRMELALLGVGNLIQEKKEQKMVGVIPEKVAQPDRLPDFENPEIQVLYTLDCNIDRDIIHRILDLPRESLVRDLEKILIDSIARLDYYKNATGTICLDTSVHAMSLLSALQAEEALETLLTVMRQGDNYYDFWYGNLITEEFWQFILMMGQNRLDRLKDFMLEPNRHRYVRATVSDVLLHIACYQPERKDEVLKWYEDTIQSLLERRDDINVFDSYVYSSLLDDMINVAGKEHLPVIMRLYDGQLLRESERYSFYEIKERLAKPVPDYKIRELYTSIDRYYDRWQELFSINSEDDPQPLYDKPALTLPGPSKIGRNDPCPCGSGKKYKKCCGAN
jgi:tetratricopeptide (TPR) repeat protein